MSEKKKFNDDKVFQSFSKEYIFESNKEQNKTSENEVNIFTFKKNLFLNESEDNNSNKKNHTIVSNEHNSNIYSKNDVNIQESGHFGKYDSKNYKKIIEQNSMQKKHPLFYIEEKFNRLEIEEKYNRMKEEKEPNNSKNMSTLQNNNSNSSLLNNQLKKIQIIRKKKSIKSINNNSSHHTIVKNIKDNSIFSYRNKNKNDEQSYLYKKKFTYNNISLNDISNIKDNSYERCKVNNTFYRLNQSINLRELPNLNKYEICNLYRNINQNYKIQNSKTNNIKNKLARVKSINNNINYSFKNSRENKENLFNYSNLILYNENMNNNNYCPNLGNSKFINFEPEKSYSNMYMMNKSSTRINRNENIEKLKNDLKIKNNKKNINLIPSSNSFGLFGKNKNLKLEKENRINNNIYYANNNSKLNTINNKSIGLYKTRTHKSKLENNNGKIIPNKKIPDKIRFLKERILKCYF